MFRAKGGKSPVFGDGEENTDLMMTMKKPWNPPGGRKGAQTMPNPKSRYCGRYTIVISCV